MDFPKIYDFDEVDTVPSALMDFADSNMHTHDVRAEASKIAKRPSPVLLIERRYPRIMAQIRGLWGTQELQDKFTHWILTDQEGRAGWPADVYSALLELSNNHAEIFVLEGNVNWGGKPDRW